MNEPNTIKKGMDVELEIESLAFGGMGVSRINEKVTFVKNAIPGQTVTARITKKRTSYLEARSLEVLSESPHFVPVKCEHFADCGGCTFQNLEYEQQVSAKELQVKDVFRRIGGFKDVACDSIVKCDEIFHYRNKMEFTFSNQEYVPESEKEREPSNFALGLHAPGRWDKILNINECHIQTKIANEILTTIKELTKDLEPYNIREHTGFLRHVMIRVAANTNEIMVNIVTSRDDPELLSPISDTLITKFPSITSIVNNITNRKAGVSLGEHQIVLHGNEYILEKLGDYEFMISADSFFQTNTKQAEKLYDIILEESQLTGSEIVYDLFCGTGSISLFLSKHAKMVYGFELVMSAVQDAMQNAIHNKVKNAWFFGGNLENLFRENTEAKELEQPDVIVVDPPRAGLHTKTIEDIIEKSPKRIVYVSCNPASQARDVALLCNERYKLVKLRPVDMFPHTPHVENVATLIQKSK
ncbi:MAG TPA: 23S rRNA (uracil(1939)-C(5))-methyltransferase RlmD [Candidatus Marinimicrobia bacterium]|nr:23S rRNA (uracil(1939)-C(5))-methyltransferase RlmD [Candidatus Neomarinimicrobiota bacterium]